jgi:hypothetical protein
VEKSTAVAACRTRTCGRVAPDECGACPAGATKAGAWALSCRPLLRGVATVPDCDAIARHAPSFPTEPRCL